ncbi:adenosylhomocysteinase [Paenibacillus durus]|uniref:S-adenosyl-L-homocysteine hydrolase NAD binding domain-containing protein n=1 Tax=Paenibacillus durus ATCC 35681 TaxID=1333534 RepID=A0A0F7CHB6_PAEDU|nr:adenosylhomocysteinase [Paenibacillus durus]AKG33600.1 hypothetical protein VK70_02530 [Paenibacillus durus ATCC 35681]
MKSVIDNASLAEIGATRMHWFRSNMPIIHSLNEQFKKEKPFLDKTIAICMHIEPKTAYWIEGILEGGAKHVYLVGCIGTTKPDTAAYLASLKGITVYGKESDTLDEHKAYLAQVMTHKIDLFLDNGASLILAHQKAQTDWKPLGANEETRTGRLLIEKAKLQSDYPIIVIDDSPLKKLLENAIGVGQSVVDGFMRATSLLVGGKKILVVGYGYVGSGIAQKFKGLGATTLVYDIKPVYRLKAKVDGHLVGELEDLIPQADVIITVTGQFDIITEQHIPLFKEGVILANSGHFGFEINVESLRKVADKVIKVKNGIEQFMFKERNVFLLENASPLNLSAGDGNPIEIMDLGLGLQSACAYRIVTDSTKLTNGLQTVPQDIDEKISTISLKLTQ